jgi:hypothetical protein
MFQQDEDVPEIIAVLISQQSVVRGGVAVRNVGHHQLFSFRLRRAWAAFQALS